ncbi:MAG: hypothetical protein OHK0057_27600 [Thermoflexibacter sp.]
MQKYRSNLFKTIKKMKTNESSRSTSFSSLHQQDNNQKAIAEENAPKSAISLPNTNGVAQMKPFKRKVK